MESTLNLKLQCAIEKHPNVAYVEQILPPVVARDTFRVISMDKLHKLLPKILGDKNALYKHLPNLFAVRPNGYHAVIEREAMDYRLGRLKSKDPERFNTLFNKVYSKLDAYNLKRSELDILAVEVADSLAEFKEVTNTMFVDNSYRRN
jgi:hypothetical protein